MINILLMDKYIIYNNQFIKYYYNNTNNQFIYGKN